MKIAKKITSATNTANIGANPAVTAGTENCEKCVESAKGYIRKAIDELGSVASTNQAAKDAIANLAVILFEIG